MFGFEVNSRYNEFYNKFKEANKSDRLYKFNDIQKEIYLEIRNLESEKQSVVRSSIDLDEYDNAMISDIDYEIYELQALSEGATKYLSNDSIETTAWYIFDKLNGIKYFDDDNEIIKNAKEYIESLDLDEDARIGIGAKYIRGCNSLGMSEFICRENSKSKFICSDDIYKVNIKLDGFCIGTIERLLEVLNS